MDVSTPSLKYSEDSGLRRNEARVFKDILTSLVFLARFSSPGYAAFESLAMSASRAACNAAMTCRPLVVT